MVIPIKISGPLLYSLISYVAIFIFLTAVTKGLDIRFFKSPKKFVGGLFAKILGSFVLFLLILILIFSSQTSGLSQLKFWTFVIGGFVLGIVTFLFAKVINN